MQPSIVKPSSAHMYFQSHVTNDDFTSNEFSTIADFDPQSNKVFPKISKQSTSAWELWFFDAVSEAGDAAVTFSFYRDGSGTSIGKAPLRTSFHVVMADGSTFGKDFSADDSLFESLPDKLLAVWNTEQQSARFEIAQDLTRAAVNLDTAEIQGSFIFRPAAEKFQPQGVQKDESISGSKFLLAPTLHWMQPIAQAAVTVDFTVDGKVTRFTGVGGHDRFWTPFSWTMLMGESFYVRATAGPYTLVLLRIISRIDVGRPYGGVLLVEDGKEIFSSQNEEIGLTDNFFNLKLSYHGLLKGAFQNANTGYVLDLVSPGEGKQWRFEMDHKKVWWNIPTGPASGNTGFLDNIIGGQVGESSLKVWVVLDSAS